MTETNVNLSQMTLMVDLALGTPEEDAVNCNILRSLLHAMLSRVRTNENVIAKIMSMMENMPKEKQTTSDECKKQMDQTKEKADMRTFDTKANDISKMIKKIINKMAVKDESWNQQCKVLSDDIGRKLDRLEWTSLKEWLLSRLQELNDQFNEQNQAPMKILKALNDKLTTGDTSISTSGSGSNSLFETNDFREMIKEIIIIMTVNKVNWNQQCKVFTDDIEEKLACLGFNSLKKWLLRRLNALNDKLKKQNKSLVKRLKTLNDKLPTGPVESSMPIMSSHQAITPTRSPSYHSTFEMEQILQHAKSDTSICSGTSRSTVDTDSIVKEKQKAKKNKSGQKVLKFLSKMMKPFRKAKAQ